MRAQVHDARHGDPGADQTDVRQSSELQEQNQRGRFHIRVMI
jgi:hypothetical protein